MNALAYVLNRPASQLLAGTHRTWTCDKLVPTFVKDSGHGPSV